MSKSIRMIKTTFVGMDATESIKSYIAEKLDKNEQLKGEALAIDVIFTSNVAHRGKGKDFRVDINVSVPNSFIHVEEIGGDIYAAIDQATDTLFRRYKKYCEKKNEWKGQAAWKLEEVEEIYVEDDYYSPDYVPKVVVRKQIEDMTPMEEAEAIERMELMGYKQLLFKNKETDKMSMVYKRERGGYGIVEPAV